MNREKLEVKSDKFPVGWVNAILGEISIKKQYGYTESASIEKIGPKFLRITDIQKDFINWKSVPYCKIASSDISKYSLKLGDIVIARTGNSTGAIATIKENIDAVFASYLIRFKPNSERADYNFLDFSLRSNKWKAFVKSIKSGSAQGGANANDFAGYPINLPPLPEQKAIAAVLSVFDDKIELLREQNETLETIAQTFYSEKLKVNSENLEEIEVTEFIEFNPTEKINRKKEYLFFDMKTLQTNSMALLDGVYKKSNSGSSFREGDTLLAKITPCLENGKTGFVFDLKGEDIDRGSTEFIVMRAKENSSPFLNYCLSRSPYFRDYAIKSMTGTSGRQRVPLDRLKSYKIKISQEDIQSLDTLLSPIFKKIKNNTTQIQTLSKTRNTLLPKLMSGEIRVKGFEQ